jgi:hypothetical protein
MLRFLSERRFNRAVSQQDEHWLQPLSARTKNVGGAVEERPFRAA